MPDPDVEAEMEETGQPAWRLVLAVAVGCVCITVGMLNLPAVAAVPALAFALVGGLACLDFWRKAIGVLVPHLMCAIILAGAIALRAVPAGDATPALVLHCSIAVAILVCAIAGKRFLYWCYIGAALPAGLAMAEAWGQFLTHRWNGSYTAVWVLMVLQIAGVSVHLREGASRLLVLSLLVVTCLLGNQGRWLGDQIRLIHLHDAFQGAQVGAALQGDGAPLEEGQPFHWGSAKAPFHLTWVVGSLSEADRIGPQAAAILSLAPLVEAKQVDITVLVQDQADPTATNLADAAVLLLPPHDWLGLLARERSNDVDSWNLQALTAIKGGVSREDPLLAYVRCTRRIFDVRQAIRARTAEAGLPTNNYLRLTRGSAILRQGIDLVDAQQLRSVVSPPGVHP